MVRKSNRLLKTIRNPGLLFIYAKYKFLIFVRNYINFRNYINYKLKKVLQNSHRKDKVEVAVENWFNDLGDSTLRLDYSLTPDSIVLDLGGYQGDFAFEIHRKYSCFVYVFEPVKKFYEHCVERFEGNSKISVLPYGISDRSSFAFISVEDNKSSVVYKYSDKLERIRLVDIKQVFDELDIEIVDLLKINVEGSEFLIIPSLIDSNLMKRVNNLQVQFHTFYPNAKKLRRSIRKKLSQTHTEVWNYYFVWESWTLK